MSRLGMPHEYAHRDLEKAYNLWLDNLQAFLSTSAPANHVDLELSRQMLASTQGLERQRSAYDNLIMQMLPKDPGCCTANIHWCAWSAWNKRLERSEVLIRLTKPGGGLELVWRLCGESIRPAEEAQGA